MEMGKLHRWCPESVIVECECGAKQALTASRTTCGKDRVDHTSIVEQLVEARCEDKVDHPLLFFHDYYTTRGLPRVASIQRAF